VPGFPSSDTGKFVLLAASHHDLIGLEKSSEAIMRFGPFLILAILLAVLWAGGFVVFHTAGFLIHVLLILAVVSLVVHLFTGARTV
jgi:hypothetical protein